MFPKVKVMNILGYLNKVNAVGKYLVLVVLVLNMLSMSFASSGLKSALTELCTISQTFLGVAALLLVVLAGAIYAIGQIMGAETRARAAVWATAMLTGAVIGAIIYIVAPLILSKLFAGTGVSDVNASSPCG